MIDKVNTNNFEKGRVIWVDNKPCAEIVCPAKCKGHMFVVVANMQKGKRVYFFQDAARVRRRTTDPKGFKEYALIVKDADGDWWPWKRDLAVEKAELDAFFHAKAHKTRWKVEREKEERNTPRTQGTKRKTEDKAEAQGLAKKNRTRATVLMESTAGHRPPATPASPSTDHPATPTGHPVTPASPSTDYPATPTGHIPASPSTSHPATPASPTTGFSDKTAAKHKKKKKPPNDFQIFTSKLSGEVDVPEDISRKGRLGYTTRVLGQVR